MEIVHDKYIVFLLNSKLFYVETSIEKNIKLERI